MKYIIAVGVAVVMVIGFWFLGAKPVEYIKETETVTETVEVDALEQAIKDAQDARRSAIEDIAQKAYDEAYGQEMKKVELEVVKAFGEKLDARQTELEKETKVY